MRAVFNREEVKLDIGELIQLIDIGINIALVVYFVSPDVGVNAIMNTVQRKGLGNWVSQYQAVKKLMKGENIRSKQIMRFAGSG